MPKLKREAYEIVTGLAELGAVMEGVGIFVIRNEAIDLVNNASCFIQEQDEEIKRLRKALENVQDQLFSTRGLDKVHDSEITGLCVEIRKALEGDKNA